MKNLILVWLGVMGMIGGGYGQTTIPTQTANFNSLQVQNNSGNSFAGTYNNGPELANYANQNSGSSTIPGAAAFRTFTDNQSTIGGNSRTLRPGDRFLITVFAAQPTTDGIIGISFKNNTTSANVGDYINGQVCRFELNNTGGWKIVHNSGTTENIAATASMDRTLQLDVTSSNTFDATIAGVVYRNLSFINSGPIASFCIYNIVTVAASNRSNPDSYWKNATLQGRQIEFSTPADATITGIISNGGGENVTALSATSITHLGPNTLTLSAASAYTGTTTIADGNLTLGANNALPLGGGNPGLTNLIKFSGTGTRVLNTGNFNLGSSPTPAASSAGQVDFDANTIINLGTSNRVYFKRSLFQVWNASSIVINGWTGTPGQSGTGPRIFFGADIGGLSEEQQAKISFSGFGAGCVRLLPSGELVPEVVGAAGPIEGPSSLIEADQNVVFKINTPTQGADLYKWVILGDNGIPAGSTTQTYNIPCNSVNGVVTVTPITYGGCSGTSSTFNVTVLQVGNAGPFNTPAPIEVCPGTTTFYSINDVNNATDYEWKVPAGSTFLQSANRRSGTVTWGTTSGNIEVIPFNGLSANPCYGGSRILAVTVAPTAVGGTASASPSIVCTGTSTVLSVNSNVGSSFQWEQSPNGSTGWVNVTGGSGANTANYTTGPISAATWYRVLVISGASCSNAYSTVASISTTSGSSGGTASPASLYVCSGTSTILSLSGHIGNIQWQSSPNGINSWIDVSGGSGATTATYTTPNLATTTYYRAAVTNGTCPTVFSSISIIMPVGTGYYVGPNNGDWNNAAHWCGGIPNSATNALIPAGLTVNIGEANAVANSLTINGGLSFSTTTAYNLTLSPTGSITNNGNFTRGIGTVLFGGSGTVNGNDSITFNNLTINEGALTLNTRPTIDGSFRINGGNLANGTNAPIYTNNSTLNYGITYTRFLEWSATDIGTIGITPGYPNNVVIDAGTFTVLNSDPGTTRALAGNLTVNTGATFTTGNLNAVLTVGGNLITNGTGTVNMAATDADITVIGSVTTNGSITLSAASGGDLNVGGNFTKTSGTFNTNGRELNFNGSGNQSYTANDNLSINFLRNSNLTGTVTFNSSLTIASGGAASFNGNNSNTVIPTGVTVTFNDNTTLATTNGLTIVSGTLISAGISGLSTTTNTSAASLKFEATGIFNHNATCNGINISPIPFAEWQTGSLCSITGLISPMAGSWPSGTSSAVVTFSNFTWNTPNLTTNPNMGGITMQINGTFSLISTGVSSEIRLTTGGTGIINTNNFTQSGGIINMAAGAGVGTLNCSSTFNRTGGTITESSNGSGNINFIGSGLQDVTPGTNINNLINFRCNKSANGISISGTLPINQGATFFRSQGTVTGNIAYHATNSTLNYDGLALSTGPEFASTNGPVNLTISTGNAITLTDHRNLPGIFTFFADNGYLITSSTAILRLTNTANTAITGASAIRHIRGPLEWVMTPGTAYTFPIGKGTDYLPAGFNDITGISPIIRMEAFSPESAATFDNNSLASVSSTEYWQATLAGGSFTGGSISLTRTAGLLGNTTIGRSNAFGGVYANIGSSGTSGNTVLGGLTGGTLGFFRLGVQQVAYYRTITSTLNWQDVNGWQASRFTDFSSPFTPAVPPSANNSDTIIIQNGHTVTINSSTGTVTLDQTNIQVGGTIVWDDGSLVINNGNGTDLVINGTFRDDNHIEELPTFVNGTGTATVLVNNDARILVSSLSPDAKADGYASDEYGWQNNVTWKTGSIFEWARTGAFSTSGTRTYFLNAGTEIPVFKISADISSPFGIGVGSTTPTAINGIFEANGTITFAYSGSKTFRNGFRGTAQITQLNDATNGSGTFLITSQSSVLGGTGSILLNGNGIQQNNGVCTLENDKTLNAVNSGKMLLNSATSTFNAQTFALSGSAGYEHTIAGSTLITANATGVDGSIGGLLGSKSFVNGVNYTFNGSANQTTGTLMGTTAGTITINNTGVTNNTVTLSNAGTNTANLTLTEGRFGTGSATNELGILSGGSVNATAGDFVTGAVAGTIFFNTSGGGSFSGNSNPYNVRIQGPVNFGAGIVTIQNEGTLRIDQNGGIVTSAPFYATGSTLQYSTNGLFNRFLEWNSTSGRGNPHHVLISNSTLLSAARGDASYAATPFVTNGNLSIEDLSSLYMDFNGQNMTIPLQIGGDLLLEGNLSGSGATGGDIKLVGNWTRSSTGAFFPNNRAVFFTGNGNTQVIMNNSALAANRLETFPYFIVDKASGDVQLSSAPTTNVLVNGASGNVLEILNGNIDLNGNLFELGGTAGNFKVDGTIQKRVHSDIAAIFRVIGDKEIIGTNGGTLLFDDSVTVEIAAGLNFGLNNLNIHVTTINATLQINPGGFADVFAPYYGPNGILVYNTGGTNYLRRVEWRGEAGEPGYPNDVIIQANTTVYAGGPNSGESVNNALSARRDVTIQAGSSLNMSGTYNMIRDLIVGRNLTINGNLTNSNVAGIDVFVGKDWTRGASGFFTNLNNGAVFFNTNQPGTISNAGGIETFPYVIVDKGGNADSTLTLAAPVDITNKFTLSSGRIITDDVNILSITNDAADDISNGVAVADYNNNPGYVDGPMLRNVKNTSVEQSYLFPVGKHVPPDNHYYKRFSMIDIDNSGVSQFKGEYKREQPPGSGTYLFQTNLFGILANEYWNVDQQSGDAKARLILPYFYSATPPWIDVNKSTTSILPNANVAIVKGTEVSPPEPPGSYNWDFTAPDSSSFANDEPLPQARFYATYGDIRSRLITSFSPFTLGFGFNNILPIKLLTFTATIYNGSGLLQWKIADATDLRQFEVEHSTNGQRFNRIGTVMPNGGLSFSYLHKNLLAGIHYYRLRMVEKDGQASFSKTEIIQVGRQQTYITGLLQNPVVGGRAIVQVNSATPQHAEAVVLDAIGRMLLKQRVQLMAGPNNVNLTVLPLPAGTYRILFRTQDGVEKVMPMMK